SSRPRSRMHGARLASLSVVRRRESLSEEPEPEPERGPRPTPSQRLKRFLLGSPKNLEDPHLFRHISLVAFLAWVGLGADGLSSSAYGPEEAFKNLGEHTYLAVFLAAATAITVLVISASYSRVIEHFPFGGGGYVVASRLIGPRAGVVSGCALIVDYVLTISISIAAGGDAIFSVVPDGGYWAKVGIVGLPLKLHVELLGVFILLVLNLRGVKESVKVLTPVFLLFLATHAIVIGAGIALNLGRAHLVAREVTTGVQHGISTLGAGGLALLFVPAQAGFIDGPRVMANMAHDSWFPHRFAALSERFTMQNGVLLMGGAGFLMLLKTSGAVDALVVLYSINVFLTFSLTQIGM